MEKVNFTEKLSKFSDHWSPKVIAEMNDYQFKLVKIEGEFTWHNHGHTDEVFIVIEGSMMIEFEDKMVMDQSQSEHIKEAARVMSIYCDFIAVRAFPSLESKKEDLEDKVINGFKRYASVPVINMESSIAHPLQALADAITIEENKKNKTPKIVLSWAPHPKALPHAVANLSLIHI